MEPGETKYFDRYEVVAVSISGAAFLLALLVAFNPHYVGSLPNAFKGISLGGLGLFAIAALIAGHMIQAVAIILENYVWNRLMRRCFFDWIVRMPSALQDTIYSGLEALCGVDARNTNANDSAWKVCRREMMFVVRASSNAGLIDPLKVDAGLSRGMFTAALLGFCHPCGGRYQSIEDVCNLNSDSPIAGVTSDRVCGQIRTRSASYFCFGARDCCAQALP